MQLLKPPKFRTMSQRFEQQRPVTGLGAWLSHNRTVAARTDTHRAHVTYAGRTVRTTSWSERA